MHEPEDFARLAKQLLEEAKDAIGPEHRRMLEGLARFYTSLADEIRDFTGSETAERPKLDEPAAPGKDGRKSA